MTKILPHKLRIAAYGAAMMDGCYLTMLDPVVGIESQFFSNIHQFLERKSTY